MDAQKMTVWEPDRLLEDLGKLFRLWPEPVKNTTNACWMSREKVQLLLRLKMNDKTF